MAYELPRLLCANMKVKHILFCQRVPDSQVSWKWLRNIEGGVGRQDLLSSRILRVQVYAERFASQPLLFWRQRDPPKLMPRIFIGLKDDRAVEYRKATGGPVHRWMVRIRMQLDGPTSLILPIPCSDKLAG